MQKFPLLPLMLAVLLGAGPALAQQTTGSIGGRVLDPQNRAVPGASVTVTNPQTGFTRTEASDGQGLYRLPALPVGTYDVQVTLEGFSPISRKSVEVNVAESATLDFKLAPGSVNVTVNVTARPGPTAAVGQLVDLPRVLGLPLNGRQFANLAATIPGVGLGTHLDPTKGTNYAPQVNGGAGRNINFLVDGGDNNDDTVGGLLQQFPLEGIQEFNFLTQRFKAEYGRSDGGVMAVVIKSGTNQYHGSLFELFRDKSMNALTESETLAGVAANKSPTKGDYQRNQFGGSFGGPVVLNKVHFFFAVERTAQDTTQTVNTKGLFPSQDGVFATRYRENVGTVKVSANVNANQYVTVRYGGNSNSFPFGASPTATPDSWADASNRFDSVNVNHNWVLGKNKLNEIVVQYTNYRDSILARSTAPNITFPNAGGITTGGNLAAPQRTEQIKYQFRDDFSWHITGHGGLGHDLKTGINFIDEPRLFISSEQGTGVVSYVMLGNSLTGPVKSVTLNGGSASANIPNKQYGFYFQDDWRVSDRLTVDAGVRYDLVTGLAFDQSKNPNFALVHAAAKAGAFSGIAGLENFGLDPQSDRNNIQPRIGAVYDVKGNGKDILRGGWGVYTDFGYINSNVLTAALDASGLRYGAVFSAADTTGTGLTNSDGSLYHVGDSRTGLTNTVSQLPLLGSWVDPRLQQPYQLQSNIGWSHELNPSTILSIEYINSLGRDLNYKPRVNQIDPQTGARRISEILVATLGPGNVLSPNNSSNRPALSRGKSQYNALILSARRRLSRGVDFSASYTLARALSTIGNASDELNTANIQDPNNPFDNPEQLGPNASTDARHRITMSAVLQLPLGIQVAPLFFYRSALPVSLVDGRDLNKDGDTFDLPAIAYAVDSTDSATGKSTIKEIGACTTVNCGRGWAQSQLNLRVSKVFRARRANVEAIGEVFNLFNAINPSNVLNGSQTNRTVLSNGALSPTLLQPASFSGDSGRPEQRVGQIGLRISF